MFVPVYVYVSGFVTGDGQSVEGKRGKKKGGGIISRVSEGKTRDRQMDSAEPKR